MKKSPLTLVKDQFGSKEKLVEAIVGLPEGILDRDDDKDAFKQRLLTAANSKLLRLHTVGKSVADRFGTKAKLVDALLQLKRRGKDQDYRTKLANLPLGKLFDQFSSFERTTKRASAAQRKA